MILPLSFLKKIEYYTEETYKTYENYEQGYRTCITLHFKSWFRRRKKIYFEWSYGGRDENGITFKIPQNLVELRSQLVEYFGNMEEQLNGPVIK